MTCERREITYGRLAIAFDVERRDRKTLEIAVEPDLSVRIAAPLDASEAAIDAKVKKRAAWICQQQAYFRQFLPRTPARGYIAGETHLYLGRQYRLKIAQDMADRVTLFRGVLRVQSTRPKNPDHTRTLMETWYREKARLKFEEAVNRCANLFAKPDAFRPQGLIIRRLERRWGSMSAQDRLLLNLRLIAAPTDAIDYVVTHELCHMKERHHGPAFFELLDGVMPDWPRRKAKLERTLA